MLLHVEAQLLGLAGEHFGELEEVEEEHQLQVFAGEPFAFLCHGLCTGRGLAGLINGDPVVFQRGGLREGGGGQIGLMRGGGIEQGLQMYFHLIIAAGLEDRAALRQGFEQNGRVRPKRGDEAGFDAFDLSGDLLAKVVLRLFAGHSHAEAALVIGDAVFDDGEGAGGGGDAGGEFATGIVRAHALQVVGGEGDEFGHADAVVIERVFQEGGERSHRGGVCVRLVKAHPRDRKSVV